MSDSGEWVESVPPVGEARYSSSLERGLAILACFSPGVPLRGISDLASELGMSRSTTHRYVTTLAALGYLEQAYDRRYRLALGVTQLGMGTMNSMSLREQGHWLLLELSRQTGFALSMAVLDGPVIEYIEHLPGTRSTLPALRLPPNSLPSAHNTATGKLLLAYLPRAVRRERLDELEFTKTGPKTITNRRRLERELRAIPEGGGLAAADEELLPGIVEIAAPVRNTAGETIAAVGLSANRKVIDVDTLTESLSPHLLATADRISARMGFRRADEPSSGMGSLRHSRLEGREP